MNVGAHTFPAPAKLNLMLRVVGRRNDGYHLLQTIFRLIDYGDDVRVTVRSDGKIRALHDVVGIEPTTDLSIRAALLLKGTTGTALGADIDLGKRLPIGSGLGGGSSDAATVLVALNHLWRTGLTRRELEGLALELGADVPVFVYGRNAIAEGIGEILSPIALPPAWYVVLTPPVAVETVRIFNHPDLKRDSQTIKIQGFSAADVVRHAANDLEPLVCRLYPEVARHLEWLGRHASACMTGSGAAVFASFETDAAARAVFAQLPPTMSGFVARGLDAHPLRDLAV